MNIHPQTPSLRHRRVEQVGIGLSLLVQNGFFLEGEIKLFWNIQNKKCVEEFLRNFKIFQNIQKKMCWGFLEDFMRILWGHWRCHYGFAQNFILDISKKIGARTAKPSKNLRNQRLLGSQKSIGYCFEDVRWDTTTEEDTIRGWWIMWRNKRMNFPITSSKRMRWCWDRSGVRKNNR